jgi:tetratricopeptide (TPR) repeat protein
MLLLTSSLQAQKNVDLDRKYSVFEVVDLPTQKIDSSWKTYALKVDDPSVYMNGGFPLQSLEAKRLLAGYLYNEENPDLKIRLSTTRLNVQAVDIKSRTTTTKDKAGKETTNYFYWYEMTYSLTAYATLNNKDGAILKELTYGQGGNKTKKGSEFSTSSAASSSYNDNRGSIQNELLRQELKAAVDYFYNNFNNAYGFAPATYNNSLWIIGSKKHPEYEICLENTEKCVKILQSGVKAISPVDDAKTALQPIIEYYKGLPGKFTTEEKGDKKIRYMAYFNLGLIYFALEEFDKTKEMADLLIKNDFDSKDGEDLIKMVNNVEKQYKLHGINTRHFDREAMVKKP